MAEFKTVLLATTCSNPVEGSLLLPQGTTSGGMIVVKLTNHDTLVKAGSRSDPGTGACATGELFNNLGGAGATVRYRDAGVLDVLILKPDVALQGAISLLTLAGTVLSAYISFTKALDDPVAQVSYRAAGTVMIIAFLLATLKFYREIKDPFAKV
jgi:hypothetical protein